MTRTIKLKNLSLESFKPYGTYTDILNPDGYSFQGDYHTFYRDQIRMVTNPDAPIAFSSMIVKKNEQLISTLMEYHNHTDVILLPLNTDGILICAPANGEELILEEAEAFRIPQGTLVCLHRGTMYDVMYPLNSDALYALVGLPERHYVNDINIKYYTNGNIHVEV